MELLGVRVELPANTPVVMLREHETERPRVLPILIGGPEASAIHSAMEGIVPPRPLTHDLLVTVMLALGATLERVVITAVREHTFFALSVRTSAPIFAEEALLDEAAVEAPEEAQEGDEEAILDEFRDFLDDVSPDDFAS